MALFVMSIPLMIVAVGIAVVPLVVVSRREVTELVREAEMKFERHRRLHPVRHRAPRERHSTAAMTSRTPPQPKEQESRQLPWYEPVLFEQR